MTIKADYFQYLEHFGSTITLAELHAHPERKDAIALRHDIDHDLDLALEMAHYEAERGLHATYFLLNSAQYWNDPAFHLKCRQLAAYGHEIGFHCNVLVEWMDGRTGDPRARVAELLAYLRASGLPITGTSAHGDRLCYQHQLSNYWIWSELRGADPAAEQRGRCAEGPLVDDPQWQIAYPENHSVVRADGAEWPLWQISLHDHGLLYDAVHVDCDRYWTDSGGTWTRSGDPLHADLSRGRHQVLIHPWWWRGPQRKFFVLSTARCGSKWLSNFVEQATSARGFHEWTLNHTRSGNAVVPDKRTSCDFQDLLHNTSEVERRLVYAGAAMTRLKADVLEANVYLEPFLPQIRERLPDFELIHLYRSGPEVIRSIINRNWFAQPEDSRHPPVPGVDWERLSQFERACWYYRLTNERLADAASRSWQFEQMVRDPAYLTQHMKEIGVVVHPLLAQAVFNERINANTQTGFPPWDKWPADYQQKFLDICGDIHLRLGYPERRLKSRIWRNVDKIVESVRRRRLRPPLPSSPAADLNSAANTRARRWLHPLNDEKHIIGRNVKRIRRRLVRMKKSILPNDEWASARRKPRTAVLLKLAFGPRVADNAPPAPLPWPSVRLHTELQPQGLALLPDGDAFENAHLLLAGGSWSHVDIADGFPTHPEEYYRGKISASCPANSCARVFALFYDRHGRLQEKQHVGNIRPERTTVRFAFHVPRPYTHCALALFLDADTLPPVILKTVRLESVPFPEDYKVRYGAWYLPPRRRNAA